MKKIIDPFDYAGEFPKHMGRGILLTTKGEAGVNSMTIGWGTIGIEWGRPVFVAYVRESRYTKELLDKNPEFTINVPLDGSCKEILGVCGTKSGRDMDKFAQLGLETEEPEVISVPGIRQLPLTLECKVIYKQDQEPGSIAPENIEKYYTPGTVNGDDFHTAYYGQVVAAYIIEQDG